MGRRKIEIKAIKDDRNRSVTFLKRKGGLFKKAHELSVLCSVDVAVFIFGSNKKLYEYSSADMRELITKYQYHGGPNEHKGPADFNGGADDDEDDDGEGTPPHVHEGSVEPHMMPPQYSAQHVPFPHLRGHTPSASPPINGAPFAPRGHTPQPPQMGSRPSSRNDYRRGPGMPQPVGPPGPQPNGYAYMPQPHIYQPPNQTMPPNVQHSMPPQPQPQYAYQPPPHPQHPQHPQMQPSYVEDQRRASVPPPQMQPYVDEQRRTSVPPPTYPPQAPPPPPAQTHQRMSPPQSHPSQLPPQPVPQMSPPQPQPQHLEVPQIHRRLSQEPQPPAPMEPKPEPNSEKPHQPFLDTASAIKKMPQRKQHSIFTPIDENRSILSQHLASFASGLKEESGPNGSRAQSVDVGSVSRTNADSSPPLSQRHNIPSLGRNSVPTIPETSFTPPSRSNSLRDGAPRPRLRVQIPDEQSEAGSNTAETLTTTSPRNISESAVQPTRRNGSDSQPTGGVVLPPPSPSASALLSAGATGPPNPFARPISQSQQGGNMNIDTPVSALPSRFLNTEFLPSPSSFYPEWNFSRNDSNTLPSPLNFATPVHGTGPSFLRDENSNKRKSPEINTAGPASDGPDEIKRVKIDT